MKKLSSLLNLDETSILHHIKKGDERMLELVYKKYYRLIIRMVSNKGGTEEEAKDVYQNAVIIFWQKARSGNLKLTSKMSTFIYAIAQNLWLKELDRKKRLSYTEKDYGELVDMEIAEREKIIAHCLSQLDVKCRKILMYHYFDEMSTREIAMKLKMANSNSAKTQKYKCKEKLAGLVKTQYSKSDFLN